MDEEQYLDWLASLPRETARLTNSRLKILDYTFKDKEIHRLVAPDINYWGAEKCIKEKSISVKRKMVRKSLQKGHTSILRRHRHLLSKWN